MLLLLQPVMPHVTGRGRSLTQQLSGALNLLFGRTLASSRVTEQLLQHLRNSELYRSMLIFHGISLLVQISFF